MLVSGLTDEALSTMISSSQGDYSGVYQSLCECAQTMADRYRQKEVTPENRHKLEIKTQAVTILLEELSKVPKDAGAIQEALSSALECHVAALQGHEHLLSGKGNTYQLVKQTQGLRKQGESSVSLLRYHALKAKFLGVGSPLSKQQKKVISTLDESKGLTLEMLEALAVQPRAKARVLAKLYYEAGLLDPDLFTKVVKHEKPDDIFEAILFLDKNELKTADNYSAVIKHKRPVDVAVGIFELHFNELLTDQNLDKILRQEDPFITAIAMTILNREGLLEADLCAGVFKLPRQVDAAKSMVELKKAGLFRQDLCTTVLEHKESVSAAFVIICLNDCSLLTAKNLVQVLKPGRFDYVVNIFYLLGKALRTPDNLHVVINHPDAAKLDSVIMEYTHVGITLEDRTRELYLGDFKNKLGVLDQKGFEYCLEKVRDTEKS